MPKKTPTDSTPAPRRRAAKAAVEPPVELTEAADNAPRPEPQTAVAGEPNPSWDEIAEAAYQRYLRRGGSHGQDFDDWVEAERELRSRR